MSGCAHEAGCKLPECRYPRPTLYARADFDAAIARARQTGYDAAKEQLMSKLEADARQIAIMRSVAATETARFLRELAKQVAALQPEPREGGE